ncbi:MAG: hypothetical protein V4661_16050 [Pseudomonadota bacterium]
MAAFTELADGVIGGAAPAEPRDISAPDVRHSENGSAAGASDACSDDILVQPASQVRPDDSFRRGSSALVKSLIAMAASQPILVTALVGLAAVAVAYEAAEAINAKFDSIMLALRRF